MNAPEITRFTASGDGGLTPAMRAAYERDGFLVLDDFFSPGDCAALIGRASALVAGFAPDDVASIFSSANQSALTDKYFLESGDEIRFFFEEEAFAPSGALKQAKELSINKIGHALHDLDPVFSELSRRPALGRVAQDLGLATPVLMQSMYIFKQPRIGGEVVCHQDATFLMTEPISVMGLWLALEPATRENGCMWALPGGHRGPLLRRFVRDEGGVRMDELTDELTAEGWPERAGAAYVPIEAGTGTLVVLHGLLPHRSGANRSDRSRQAYALHLVDGSLPWPADNWLQRRPERPARGFAKP